MVQKDFRYDSHCRLCGSKDILIVLPLKPSPLGDKFVSAQDRNLTQKLYPLELGLCSSCGYVHLPYLVNPSLSYEDYLYVSAVTSGLPRHYLDYARDIVSLIQCPKGSLVVDLGSNDGTMLRAFNECGMKVLGVEPCNSIAQKATQNGIPTFADYFSDAVAEKITMSNGKASIVTANYVYANVDDVVGFTKNVASILERDGIFVVQTGYHPDQMKIKMFDYIYHEHFSYFTVTVVNKLFSKCGLELIDAQRQPARGGSIRLIAQKLGGPLEPRISIQELINEERLACVHKPQFYRNFETEINHKKDSLVVLLNELKDQDKRIVGYGASHSTTTLIYHFELQRFLDYLVDDNSLKHGKYSPGCHLPVFPSNVLHEDMPDFVLILAWNYKDSIIERNRSFLDKGGKFLIPLPNLEVI